MHIAFVLSYPFVTPANGIISQAESWKKGLEAIGHTVTCINMWQRHDWRSFDAIHYFGFSTYMRQQIDCLDGINEQIVVSPILDPWFPRWVYRLYSYWGNDRLKLRNNHHSLRRINPKVKMLAVRSNFEKSYLKDSFGFSEERCSIIPLSLETETPIPTQPKEDLCFHCSLLADERKNVRRLIQAAQKYGFRLVLGGYTRNIQEEQKIKDWIGGSTNIEYLGYLSREEMLGWYSRAKVFALPSTNEGVGIVALEAAAMGCDIVLTSLGGPKEYYDGMALTVDPYNIDEIGQAVNQMLNGKTYQPKLAQWVREKYSPANIARELESMYLSIRKR